MTGRPQNDQDQWVRLGIAALLSIPALLAFREVPQLLFGALIGIVLCTIFVYARVVDVDDPRCRWWVLRLFIAEVRIPVVREVPRR